MKRILVILNVFLVFLFVSCQKDEWSDGDPAYDHVYYFGFENWGNLKNDVSYNVTRGDTIGIPVQFWSENPMDVDVITYYYVSGDAISGTDYEIVDEDETVLEPDTNGAFSMVWPGAVKGVKNIYVKALSGGSTGKFKLLTFDPSKTISYTSTMNDSTANYEVHAFTQNYYVTVNIK